jgi:peptidoglycan DL-endopeptidase CwlO
MLLVWSGLAVACASTGAVPRPFPTPGGSSSPPTEPIPTPAPAPAHPAPRAPGESVDGYALAGTALSFRGVPYRAGGASPDGFDCSGLVHYVFGQHGFAVPREAREQFRLGRRVDRQDLQPGDLVFFSTVAPGASHVGIALGGDQFVHAPTDSGVVRVERLGADYWTRRYIGAKRVN